MANFSTSQASNQNYLKAQSFQFKLQKAPKMTYNCQAGPLPGISFDSIPLYTAGRTVPMHLAALNPTYDDLELRFMVDEKLENWKEIYDWMTSIQNAKEFGDGSTQDGPIDGMSDGSLLILTSAYNPVVQIDFLNLFPKTLSGLDFDSASLEAEPALATVTFAYQAYNVTVLP